MAARKNSRSRSRSKSRKSKGRKRKGLGALVHVKGYTVKPHMRKKPS